MENGIKAIKFTITNRSPKVNLSKVHRDRLNKNIVGINYCQWVLKFVCLNLIEMHGKWNPVDKNTNWLPIESAPWFFNGVFYFSNYSFLNKTFKDLLPKQKCWVGGGVPTCLWYLIRDKGALSRGNFEHHYSRCTHFLYVTVHKPNQQRYIASNFFSTIKLKSK